ncbi:hypothetical protein L4174_024000 (plasmid) [Photobacterium sp. CCB-ST2H9]|uniref:hypothetical protein n=1 Tax=Photobacterium sp. CCB-ST2H9 TaxID=2912855 RepID=UPI0020058314|nr:hypothetical protein [Photobacterium sp. CCB-ST2H9]UTM60450.1 hypothetical protein L4174_024000 [Photobacterium sp. CCB-ST2H9]
MFNFKFTKVLKLSITGAQDHHPVSVFMEDIEQGRGKLYVECVGTLWSANLKGLGKCTVSDFVVTQSTEQLAKILDPHSPEVFDEEALKVDIRKRINDARSSGKITRELADSLYEKASFKMLDQGGLVTSTTPCRLLFGCDAFHIEMPTKPNPNYTLICRIIDTIKLALSQEMCA